MDEQPKPAPRRTATKTATKTAGGAAKGPRTAAKATPAKAAANKRSPAKSAPAPAASTSDTSDATWSSASPRIRDLIARLGPDARDWVARTRERYPAATPAAVARLAATQRREPAWLVLAVAAAYGLDPTDPARAADFRELTIHSGRFGLEGRARARYSQDT
jgi:hypothetical protein